MNRASAVRILKLPAGQPLARAQVTSAFKREMLAHHPDKVGANTEAGRRHTQAIKEARDYLLEHLGAEPSAHYLAQLARAQAEAAAAAAAKAAAEAAAKAAAEEDPVLRRRRSHEEWLHNKQRQQELRAEEWLRRMSEAPGARGEPPAWRPGVPLSKRRAAYMARRQPQ